MFQQACSTIRGAVYGIMCWTRTGKRVNFTNGTAFMIAPGVLVTTAHGIHVESNHKNPVHDVIEVIRTPDIGQRMEKARIIAEDITRDVVLLQIDDPSSGQCVVLEQNTVPIGTSCGSLGFPLAYVTPNKRFHLVERFQGAHISAFYKQKDPTGGHFSYYETDALMYRGSSGCPGFIVNGNVFGMHNRSVVDRPRSQQQRQRPRQAERLAISLWIPSIDIRAFASDNGVSL